MFDTVFLITVIAAIALSLTRTVMGRPSSNARHIICSIDQGCIQYYGLESLVEDLGCIQDFF